jgi:hypothetical protein
LCTRDDPLWNDPSTTLLEIDVGLGGVENQRLKTRKTVELGGQGLTRWEVRQQFIQLPIGLCAEGTFESVLQLGQIDATLSCGDPQSLGCSLSIAVGGSRRYPTIVPRRTPWRLSFTHLLTLESTRRH